MVVTPETFRRTLSRLAGGVTVVAARRPDGTPSGLTATSVCSVSLEPPLVLVCLERETRTHDVVDTAGCYVVNLLHEGQEALARRFAGDSDDKFVGIGHEIGLVGAPVLDDSLGYLECEVVRTVPAGDHTIFVGRVRRADPGEREGLEPLVYYRADYHVLGELSPASPPRAEAQDEAPGDEPPEDEAPG